MKTLIITTLLAAGLMLFAPRAIAKDKHRGHYSYHHYNPHGNYYGHEHGYYGYGYARIPGLRD